MRIGKIGELLGEGLVLAECGFGNLGTFAVAKRNLDGSGDRDALRLRFYRRRWCGLNWRLIDPGLSLFPSRRQGLRFIPIGFAGLFAVEFSAQRAGHMNEARAFLPATAPFFELAGTVIFGMSSFALSAVAAIEGECNASLSILLDGGKIAAKS